jgi:hypothetical protein
MVDLQCHPAAGSRLLDLKCSPSRRCNCDELEHRHNKDISKV